jgi:hypothetical protein
MIPTYDCKGAVAVKFSHVKNIISVEYKHLPIHENGMKASQAKSAKAR